MKLLFARLRALFTRTRREREMTEEFEGHLAMHVDDNIRAGMTPEEARRQARLKFGGIEVAKELYRDSLGWAWLETLLQDVRFGFRSLRKTPAWTLVVGGTLVLGVGLTTAIFSIVYGVLLQPLPYRQPERLVALWSSSTNPALPSRFNVIAANWQDWRKQARTFEDIALVRNIANFNLTGDGPPERLQGARTSANLTAVLGVAPIFGRMFTEEETQQDAHVAVLSYGLWQRLFARDPRVLGRTIQLNGTAFEIIGIMPHDYHYPTREFELWMPLFVPPDELRDRAGGQYSAVARLRPGVSLMQAQADISSIMQRLEQQYPVSNRQMGALVEPLLESSVADIRTTLYVLLAASGSLLLIGCMNLSILLIGRVSDRAREISVRAALGASPSRIRRQLLAELIPLGAAGIAGGVFLAYVLLRTAVPLLPTTLPRIEAIALHWPVLVFSAALSLLTVLGAALLPSRIASRIALGQALQRQSRGVSAKGGIRDVLVSAQVAIALVLVFGGGLLARSLVALLRVDPGYTTEGILTMHMVVTRAQYPEDTQVANYFGRLVDRVQTIPGVQSVGVVNRLPLSGINQTNPVQVDGMPDLPPLSTDTRSITPGYFGVMGIRLVRGRTFSDIDKKGRPNVVIIDESLASKLFQNADPLGKRIRLGFGNLAGPWTEVVGIVGHISNDMPGADSRPQVYFPQSQRPQDRSVLVVRTQGDPAQFTSAVIEQIRAENPDQAVYDVRTMRDWLDRTLSSRNLMTSVISMFSGAALLLAGMGLFGVAAYTANLRSREFGIRLALGARPAQVQWAVLGHAGKLVLCGLTAGFILIWPAARAIRGLLFGVSATDPITLVAVPAVLLLVALLASSAPARRAARTDPMTALRSE